jgi:hypothetical protein
LEARTGAPNRQQRKLPNSCRRFYLLQSVGFSRTEGAKQGPSMSDSDALLAGHQPPRRRAKLGELLFDFYAERNDKFYRCERDHGKWGHRDVEGEHNFHAYMFQDTPDVDRIIPARQLAMRWTNETRALIEKGYE